MSPLTVMVCPSCGKQRPSDFRTWGPLEDEALLGGAPRTPRQSGALTDMMTWFTRGYPQGLPNYEGETGRISSWGRPNGIAYGTAVACPTNSLGLADYVHFNLVS